MESGCLGCVVYAQVAAPTYLHQHISIGILHLPRLAGGKQFGQTVACC